MKKTFIRFGSVCYKDANFGRNQENRKENHAHVQKLKKQWLTSADVIPSITVNVRTNNIIDGQQRTRAWRELIESGELDPNTKLKVMYVDIPVEEETQAIIDANTNSKNWSLDDYIASYAKAGIVSYMKLDEWCKRHPLTSDNGNSKFRYGAAIIKGKRCATELKAGGFMVEDEELEKAEEVHAEMLEIVELFGLKGKGTWIESLATSWCSIRSQHEFRVWMKELKTKKQKFLKFPKDNTKDWDTIFAQIHTAIDKKAA